MAQPRTYVPRTGFEEETQKQMQPAAGDSWMELWSKAKQALVQVSTMFVRFGQVRGNMVRTEHGARMDPTKALLHTEHPLFACAMAVVVFEQFRLPYRLQAGYYHHRDVSPENEANVYAWVMTPDPKVVPRGEAVIKDGPWRAELRTDLTIFAWGKRGPIALGSHVALRGLCAPGAEYYAELPPTMTVPKKSGLLTIEAVKEALADLGAWARTQCPVNHLKLMREVRDSIQWQDTDDNNKTKKPIVT